jgi:hypothetical protein
MTYFPNEVFSIIISYCDDNEKIKLKKNVDKLNEELIEKVNRSKEHYHLCIDEFNYPEEERDYLYNYMLDQYIGTY